MENSWSAGCCFTARSQRGPESRICRICQNLSSAGRGAERLNLPSQRVGAHIDTTVRNPGAVHPLCVQSQTSGSQESDLDAPGAPNSISSLCRKRPGCTIMCSPSTFFWEFDPQRPGQGTNWGLVGRLEVSFREGSHLASRTVSRADSTPPAALKANLSPSLWSGEEDT